LSQLNNGGYLRADWLHTLDLLKPLPLFLLAKEGQQATEPFLTLGMVQLIQIVVPEACANP